MATVIAKPQTCIAVSASARPMRTELRGMGSERRRAMSPALMSSAMPADAYMALKSTPVVMKPGTTKLT